MVFCLPAALYLWRALNALPPLAEIEKQLPPEALQGKKHLATLLPKGVKFTADAAAARPPECRCVVKDDMGNLENLLRLFALVKNTPRSSAETLLLDALKVDVEEGKKALGASTAAAAMEKRGVAVPLYTAHLSGAPDITSIEGAYVLARVWLLECFFGTLADVLRAESPLPFTSEEYVARPSVSFGEEIRADLLEVSLPFVAPEIFFAFEAKKTGEALSKGVDTLEATLQKTFGLLEH
ncbi:hypothetical protein Esti_000755 [Eimeria stiedai]